MKVEYLNPFIQSTTWVLKELGSTGDTKLGSISVAPNPHVGSGVVVVIGLTGQLAGRVLYDMERQTASNLAAVMMGDGSAPPEFGPMVRDAIGELGNMVSGNAATRLHEAGYKVDITPPMVVTGSELTLTNLGELSICLIVPLQTPCGVISVNLAVKEVR